MTWTPEPEGQLVEDAIVEIERYISMPRADQFDQECLDGLNDAVDKLNRRVWRWALTSVSIPLASNTDTYVVSEQMKSPFACEVRNATDAPAGILDYMAPREFGIIYANRQLAGSPSAYTFQNIREDGLLMLNCVPTDAFIQQFPTLLLRFYRRVQRVVLADIGTVTLNIVPEAESFAKWHAKSTFAGIHDQAKEGSALSRANQAYQELWIDDNEHDYRAWNITGLGFPAGGAGVATASPMQSGALPATGNVGQYWRVPGPPDVFYQWQTPATGPARWVEIGRGPDT